MKPVCSSTHLSRLVLNGFKSIKTCALELGRINVLIGSNGAGKSNFIGFFKMVQAILDENLQGYVTQSGGPDAFLHYGRKVTSEMDVMIMFENRVGSEPIKGMFQGFLQSTQDNKLMFHHYAMSCADYGLSEGENLLAGKGCLEIDPRHKMHPIILERVVTPMLQWRVYHFHDTGDTAIMKQLRPINDNEYFRPDGSNLAPFLFFLKNQHPGSYERIVKTIQLVAPFFKDFKLRPAVGNDNIIELEWMHREHEDIPFKAFQLSDGTLRFICLATVLLQPKALQPETILMDEPELGLPPSGLMILADLIRATSKETQIILSTQSIALLNEFELRDIILVERRDGASVFLRPENQMHLSAWLEEYSLGELWQKN